MRNCARSGDRTGVALRRLPAGFRPPVPSGTTARLDRRAATGGATLSAAPSDCSGARLDGRRPAASSSRAGPRTSCAGRRQFGAVVRGVVDGRRGAAASGLAGAARRRRVLPRHRLPLRRDHRHPGRGRGDLPVNVRHVLPRQTVAEQDADVRRPAARARPRPVLRAAQGRAAGPGAGAVRRPGSPGCAGTSRRPGRTRRWSSGTPSAAWSRSTRSPPGPQDDVDAYIAEHGVLVNPLLDDGYGSIGCAPVHPAG